MTDNDAQLGRVAGLFNGEFTYIRNKKTGNFWTEENVTTLGDLADWMSKNKITNLKGFEKKTLYLIIQILEKSGINCGKVKR